MDFFDLSHLFRIYEQLCTTRLQVTIMLRYAFSLFLLAVLLCDSLPAQQSADSYPQARLLPGKLYSVTIKRSYGGNNGYREQIPNLTTQQVTIVTAPAGENISIDMTVYPPVRVEDRRENIAPATPQWTFHCALTPDGTVRDLAGLSDEGELPMSLVSGIFARQLDEILFRHGYALEVKGKRDVTISGAEPRGEGDVMLRYAAAIHPGVSGDAEPVSVTIEGTALFDARSRCFNERRHMEQQLSTVVEGLLKEQESVQLSLTTTIFVSVTDK